MIDLRSDTVTKPTPEMRRAMAEAAVGDDVYGEDPTVNRLQEISSDLMGKEAGLFVPSGTMGNLAAILAHCNRGDEVILGNYSHTFLYEAGGYAVLGGVHPNLIPNQKDGTLALDDIESAIRPDDPHQPITRLICLENTHNRCGGVSLSAEYTREVAELARKKELKIHLDGARIFNAAIAQGTSARELAAPVDSVTFCLSKSLCAPVGSVLCGSGAFIERAHRVRKQLGGGMRQAGVIAAAGVVALESMVERLGEDHQRARQLADGLEKIPGISPDPGGPYSNMIYVSLSINGQPVDADLVARELEKRGVLVGKVGKSRFRLVTHYWIDDQAIERTLEAFARVLKQEGILLD